MNVLYLCDGKACEKCDPTGECKHTSDIRHAKNFEVIENQTSNGEYFQYALEKSEES